MRKLPDSPSPEEVEAHFRNLLESADMIQPDEVRHDLAAGELVFLWEEPKVAIVIELGPDGPVDVRPGAAMHEPPV